MRDFYRITGDRLGAGSYGEVRKCLYIEGVDDDGYEILVERAVKVLSKAHMDLKDIRNFYNEVECLYELNATGNKCFLKIFHFFEDPKRFMLVSELCRGKDLQEKIIEEKEFNHKDAAYVIKQLLTAVDQMH